jgi:hypothetical protein
MRNFKLKFILSFLYTIKIVLQGGSVCPSVCDLLSAPKSLDGFSKIQYGKLSLSIVGKV